MDDRISVIVPTYNRKVMLLRLLESSREISLIFYGGTAQ